jgi:hypothetical protein
MRHLMHCAIGFALVIGCSDPQGSVTSEGTGKHGEPAFARAEVTRTNVGFGISAPDSPLIVWVGFDEGVTLADICSGPQPLSVNSISHVTLPPSGAFLAASHGQDVPILVYRFEGDICDGQGESLVASGTARFHFHHTARPDGTIIDNSGVRGILELESGGQALLAVRSPFYLLPDGSVKFDKTHISLTPL